MSQPMHRSLFRSLAVAILWLACVVPGRAQEFDEQYTAVLNAAPGKQRVKELLTLSGQERGRKRYREAVEVAMQAVSEAERHGLHKEHAQALMELTEVHRERGSLDNAIGAALRVTMIDGTLHSGVRTKALWKLAELYMEAGHPQKALEHLEEAANSTGAAGMGKAEQLRLMTRAKAMTLPPDGIISYVNTVKHEVEQLTDRTVQLDVFSILATAQARKGSYAEALRTEEQVMQLAIGLDRPEDAAICANNLGALYHLMGRTAESLNAYNRGLIMVEDLPEVMVRMRLNTALALARSGSHDQALKQLSEVEKELGGRRVRREGLMARLLRTKAAVLTHRGELAGASEAALNALKEAEQVEDLAEQAAACDMLAMILEKRELPMESRNYQRRANELESLQLKRSEAERNEHEAQLVRLQRIEREQVDVLNREQRKEGKLKQLALDAENREKQLALLQYEKQLEESARREAIFAHEQKTRELLLVQAKLESERQDRTIQELDNSRLIQNLQLSRMELEKKEQQRSLELLEERSALAQAKEQRERIVKRLSIALAILAAAIAIWMAYAWVITNRKKRTIWEQNQRIKGINDELAEKNQNIQSSLGYAQTIQSAILPSEQDLRAILPESFLLYKPLDIVSGDLPFVRRVGDRVFVAAIDCTGHGVPAAMMTFIAYYGLSELLANDPNATSAQLLDRLHEHVKRTMEARGDGSLYNDGFDIGLCAIDTKRGTLSFAGAQLPVIHVRGEEVTRIKGDVLPIGDAHFERPKGYQEHCMELKQGDALFLFSDGIIHQFGGETGRKKFSMKRLTELLANNAAQDLDHIKALADSSFNEWKGDTHQTDDVLLIGLRIAA